MRINNRVGAAVIAAVLALVGVAVYTASSSTAATTTATHHFVANVSGYDAQAAALGYNVLDTASVSAVSSLPAGTQAMFWLGAGQKCPTAPDSSFTSTVDKLAGVASRVYAVYLTDEPQASGCPSGPANVKARRDYVKSKLPAAKTFIVIDHQDTFAPYRPAVTGVDLVGLDPYPCNVQSSTCDFTKVAERVGWATSGGWSKSQIVPTFQLFGQTCQSGGYYRFPTDSELNQLLADWQAAGPFSDLDYSYSWKNQLPNTSCPTLTDKPSAQAIMRAYFATAPSPVSTPAPVTSTSQPATLPVPTTGATDEDGGSGELATTLSCPVPPAHPHRGDTLTCTYR